MNAISSIGPLNPLRMASGRIARLWICIVLVCGACSLAVAEERYEPPYSGSTQLSHFPRPVDSYHTLPDASLLTVLKERVRQEPFNLVATSLFVLAVVHTFASGVFRKLAHKVEQRHVEIHGEDTERVSFWA